MPKRRHSDDFEHISRKIKKLERKLKRARHRNRNSDVTSRSSTPQPPIDQPVGDMLDSSGYDILDSYQELEQIEPPESQQLPAGSHDIMTTENQTTENHPSSATEAEVQVQIEQTPHDSALDLDALEILGADPSATVQYAKNIHNELAARLEHIATAGLTKELRKELNERYLIPANCVKIGAPSMNPEIKAAVTEIVMKRDKGIEARQKQLSAAIAGLSAVLSSELEKKDKDSTTLKQLMDVSRILCDIQHSESITRRNFAVFSIKKELKDHVLTTKIDKTLFGENLAETLKSAKAVSKSGSEIKTKTQPKPKPSTSYSATTTNLNWRGPAPGRRQQAPHRNQGSTRPPATTPGPQQRFTPNQTHASSSKPLHPPFKQIRRR